MSRIKVNIDQIILRGIDPTHRHAFSESLQTELSRVLADSRNREKWARSHRTPVLRLGATPVDPSRAGMRTFGQTVARAIGKGLKP